MCVVYGYIVAVQSFSPVRFFLAPGTAACQASLSFTISKACSNSCPLESMMSFNYLDLCCPLLFLPSIFPSIRVFSNVSALPIRCPKYWNFSFSLSPSSAYSGLISFGIDWFDFLAVQGTLRSFLQHHSSKVSIIWHSPFFMVQFSHPYMITGKNIALTIQTFVGNVISL